MRSSHWGCVDEVSSDFLNIRGLQALRSLLDIELHLIALVQRSVTFTPYRLEVDEHVLAVLTGDEAITLGSVEPFHCSLFHGTIPFGDVDWKCTRDN
jgi:hypothetical protein